MKKYLKTGLEAFRRISMGVTAAGGVLLVLGGVVSFFVAGEIYRYQDTVQSRDLPQVDAIVCLAGGRGRILAAGELWYRYYEESRQKHEKPIQVPTLYFAGLGSQTTWNLVSKQLSPQVLKVIQPARHVIIEKESFNTDANARWFARYAQEQNWHRAVLLTSTYHMRRAEFIFRHVLESYKTPVKLETYSVYQSPFALQEWRKGTQGVQVTLTEYIKWVYYRSIWAPF